MVGINDSSNASISSCCTFDWFGRMGEICRHLFRSQRTNLPLESGQPGIFVTLWWAKIEKEAPGKASLGHLALNVPALWYGLTDVPKCIQMCWLLFKASTQGWSGFEDSWVSLYYIPCSLYLFRLTTSATSWCNLLHSTVLLLGRCHRMKGKTLGIGAKRPLSPSFSNVWLGHIFS